jgi:hypothetical protein
MKLTQKKHETKAGKWLHWISGGALMLALASPLVIPTTSNAVIDIGEEVIEIEGEAPESPWNPTNLDGHDGGGAPNGTPGGESGGGGASGGGSVPSAGGSTSKQTPAEQRLAVEKHTCVVFTGEWKTAVFNDYDTDVAFAGYVCKTRLSNNQYSWKYFDSEGYLNQRCRGDSEVVICEPPVD